MSESVPIKIKSFTAHTQSDKSVILKWESDNEIDSYEYVVQKNFDGRTFFDIGNLKAAGNSAQPTMYTFHDRQLFNGAAYYRLKLVDMDGSFEYSRIIYVNNGQVKLGVLPVFPNPFRSEMQIKGVAASDVIHNNIRIFDASGRKIPFSIRGANAISIDPTLPKGIYLLKFKEQTIKLFKE